MVIRMEAQVQAEKDRIGYFWLQKGVSAKRHLWSAWKLDEVAIDMGEEGSLQCCCVPEFYLGERHWEGGKLVEALQGILDGWSCREWYLQPELSCLLEMEERLPPPILMKKLLKRVACWEYLFYIGLEKEAWDEGADLFYLLEEYLPRINHFTLVTDRPGAYGEFVEYIYKEYGIPTACVGRMEKRLGRDGRTVVLDGRRDYRLPYLALPERTVYVDFWSDEGKRGILAKMRRDVSYISTAKFLDTLVKNGYNTIVN